MQTLDAKAGALDCEFEGGDANVQSCFGKSSYHIIHILLKSFFLDQRGREIRSKP